MKRIATVLAVASTLTTLYGCGESREEKLRRELAYQNAGNEDERTADDIEKIPPHPTRDAMAPLLDKMYSGTKLPDVKEGAVESTDPERPFDVSAGVLAKITIKEGMSEQDKARAIILATAEADAWVHRENARKTYADHIHKVFRSFGEDQKFAVLHAYSSLKLLDFFNSEDAGPAIGQLSGAPKAAAEALQAQYTSDKDAVWNEWMEVKMYARREVAGDEPFRSVLRKIRKELGKEEPTPLTWATAHGPEFKAWAEQINSDPELFKIMTNLKELREQEDFRNDTHTMWVMEGSSSIPEKAKGTKVDPDLGWGVHREDLGGGYQEMTFVFSKKLSGNKLKQAYLRSHIYRQIFTDFQTLSASGGDFKEGIVPDKYDPAYAKCGSEAAIDAFITSYKGKFSILEGTSATFDKEDKIMERAVECIVRECSPEIRNPDPDDEKDKEGPAPGSRLAFFQMLARFQSIDVDMAKMREEKPKSQEILDAEAFLKANPNEHQ